MQFTNPTTVPTSFVADGGTVTSVTDPVTTDPASTIAVVSTSVPFLFQDAAFWPSISGESFPPVLSSASYGVHNNLPAYQQSAAGGQVTFPQMPRTSIKGKQNMKFSFLWANTAAVTSNVLQWGASGVTVTSGTSKAFQLSQSGGGQLNLRVTDGTGVESIAGPILALDGAYHAIEIDISAAGVVSLIVDGVNYGSTAVRFLTPATIMSALAPNTYFGGGSATSWLSQLQIGWT